MKNKNLDLFVESLYKLKTKIAVAVVTLKLENETHVPDLMTRIRILPSVAVVGQTDRVDKYVDGETRLKISIKYLPKSQEILKSLKALCTMIKRLDGVITVSVDSYEKRKITLNGKKLVF
mgnify:CR=1 FL=1